jgi:hypothetical protein
MVALLDLQFTAAAAVLRDVMQAGSKRAGMKSLGKHPNVALVDHYFREINEIFIPKKKTPDSFIIHLFRLV